MNREDIIRMMQSVCDTDKVDAWHNEFWTVTQDELERFAALVAAAEREKVARWIIYKGYATGHGDTIEDLLTELEWQVAECEREACCKIVYGLCESDNSAQRTVDAIRARGEVPR